MLDLQDLLNQSKLPPVPKQRVYTDKNREDAMKLYLATKNMSYVAETLQMPRDTLKQWRGTEWWKEMEIEFKQQETLKLSQKLVKLASKSMTLIEDRLDNGDFILNQKTGELIQKPIDAKVANGIMNTALERSIKLEKASQKDDSALIVSKLSDLARRFEEIANKKTPVNVTDVVYIEKEDKDEVMHQVSGDETLQHVQLEECQEPASGTST